MALEVQNLKIALLSFGLFTVNSSRLSFSLFLRSSNCFFFTNTLKTRRGKSKKEADAFVIACGQFSFRWEGTKFRASHTNTNYIKCIRVYSRARARARVCVCVCEARNTKILRGPVIPKRMIKFDFIRFHGTRSSFLKFFTNT